MLRFCIGVIVASAVLFSVLYPPLTAPIFMAALGLSALAGTYKFIMKAESD